MESERYKNIVILLYYYLSYNKKNKLNILN